MQLPIGAEADFKGVIDLVRMKALVWSAEAAKGEMYDIVDIPDTHAEAAEEYRNKLCRGCRGERRRDHGAVPGGPGALRGAAVRRDPSYHHRLRQGHRHHGDPGVLRHRVQEQGRPALLDAVVRYLPSPVDIEAIEGHDVKDPEEVVKRKPADSEPLAALAFKIMSDPHLGKLTFVRVYSGRLESGTSSAELRQGQEGAHRQDLPHARQQA